MYPDAIEQGQDLIVTTPAPSQGCLSLDLSGKFCPQVVLDVAQFVRALPQGTQILITSTDPLSSVDLPLFSLRSGHSIERYPPESGRFCYLLTLGAPHSVS
jgi:TusA-related sulfurtransferase